MKSSLLLAVAAALLLSACLSKVPVAERRSDAAWRRQAEILTQPATNPY